MLPEGGAAAEEEEDVVAGGVASEGRSGAVGVGVGGDGDGGDTADPSLLSLHLSA